MLCPMLKTYFLRHPFAVDILKKILSDKRLINNKFYHRYALKKANQYAGKYPHGVKGIAIETTLSCNARCIMCYHSHKHLSGTMSMDLFKKIIDDCFINGIMSVGLSIYGEPLMDEYFFDRIKYLRRYGMKYGFFTNGSLLNDKKARMLFDMGGLEKINFSVCGFEREVYEQIMPGLKKSITYENILNFLRLKKEYALNKPVVAISSVKLNKNKNDMKKFIRFWQRQKGVNHVITAGLWKRGSSGQADIGEPGQMHRGDCRLYPCKVIWGSIYVYYDGRTAPCCEDSDLRGLIIGDMNKQSIEDIYKGKEIEALRRMHLEGKRHHDKICGQCTHNFIWL